jgi:site-specific DNA-methyltransferase (adenine-specific)
MIEMDGMIRPNSVIQGDCVEVLSALREPIADLIVADPPFNIGYKYDLYQDRKAYDDYYSWTKRWMGLCVEKALKPTGSFWVAIGDEYAAEVKLIGDGLGLHLRNWVIWHYTFGQNTKKKFARSHTHLFYWVKEPRKFKFRPEALRIPSDRLREYADRRAHKDGKLPDDVWTEFPRVCGTFSQRERWHPCQMPETLLARILRACTDPGDLVLDPFAGSGTTLAVAKKIGRHFVGVEVSPRYVSNIQKRLAQVRPMGDVEGERWRPWPPEHVQELQALYAEAGITTDVMFKNPSLLDFFARQFNHRIELRGHADGYDAKEVWIQLEKLRKGAKLPRVRIHAKEPAAQPIRDNPPRLFGN